MYGHFVGHKNNGRYNEVKDLQGRLAVKLGSTELYRVDNNFDKQVARVFL